MDDPMNPLICRGLSAAELVTWFAHSASPGPGLGDAHQGVQQSKIRLLVYQTTYYCDTVYIIYIYMYIQTYERYIRHMSTYCLLLQFSPDQIYPNPEIQFRQVEMDAFLQKRMVGRTCMSRRTVDSPEIFHDFPWTEKSLSPYHGFGSLVILWRKRFVRKQKVSFSNLIWD